MHGLHAPSGAISTEMSSSRSNEIYCTVVYTEINVASYNSLQRHMNFIIPNVFIVLFVQSIAITLVQLHQMGSVRFPFKSVMGLSETEA